MADKTLPPLAFGDSLAQGMRDANQLAGISRVGAGPKEVYEMLQRYATENSLSGRDVFLGTGMPNIPEQKKFIEQQIDFVKKQGGNPILIGVGPGTKTKPTTGQNEFLSELSQRKGLKYMGPLANQFPDITKDPMGLHLHGSQYKQLFQQYSKPTSQTQQTQPQSRASASDMLAQFTGAVMQAESKGKRYDKSGKLLTSSAGAMGEMQVMPGTVRDPGFGVRPARDSSPDELARVGRDYAATMLKRYNNDPTAAAVAYNWGPGNADKWVKRGADFGALPKETQNYVTRITGQMNVPIAAKRAPVPKRADVPPVPPQKRAQAEDFDRESTLELSSRPAEQPQDQVTRADMERMGPGYQAAFAAMTLADSREDDDEYDDDETIAERYLERREMQMAQEESTLEPEEPTRTSPLASLSELSYQSPFAQKEQPVMMADGGLVYRAEGSPPQGEAQAMMEDLEPTFGQRMGAKLSDVATKGLINIYDAARFAESALSSKESAAEKEQKMSAAHKIYLDTFGFRGRRDPVTAEYFNPEEQKAIAALIAEKGGKKGSIQYKDYGMDKRKLGPQHVLAGKLDPYVSVNKSLGQFNYEFDPKTKSYRVTDQYDFNPLVGVGGRQVSSDFMGDYLSDVPGLYNKARIYAGRKMPPGTGRKVDFTVPAPVRRAEGSPIYGEIADLGPITADTRAAFANRQSFNPREALAALKRIGMEGVSNFESMARGSVAGVPGVVGDVESLFRDDKARRFATSTEVERDYLPKRMSAPTKEAAGFTEIGTAIDPTIVGKVARPTAKAALKAMKSAGPQIEATLGKMAPAAEPMYVIKPKGGVFYPQGSGSNLDNYLETVAENVLRTSPNIPGKEAGKIKELILNKGRKYFTTTYGTQDDPVRSALLEGRVKLVGREAELLPPELLRAAQDGNPEALSKFDQRYDIWSNMRGEVVSPAKDWTSTMTGVRKKQKDLMRQEGVEDELINPQLISKSMTDLRESFPSDSSKMLADLLDKKRGPVSGQEQAIIEAAKREQPIYDFRMAGPEFSPLADAAQGIASLTIKDIEKMSYPEMVIRGAQNTVMDRSVEALFKAARDGKPIPEKSYRQGVTPIKGLENTGWVTVDSSFAVQLEGSAMNHSVGDYAKKQNYEHGGKEGFLSGKAKVFSLRPEGNKPVTTVSARVDPEGLYISQVKGPYNSLPTQEEKAKVFKLFDNLKNNYGRLDFKSATEPEKYKYSRTGKDQEKMSSVNWEDEYSNYLSYKNKGAE